MKQGLKYVGAFILLILSWAWVIVTAIVIVVLVMVSIAWANITRVIISGLIRTLPKGVQERTKGLKQKLNITK